MIAVGTSGGMRINFIGINPISALFWTAVINGVLAPPLLVLLKLIANNPKVRGERVNGRWLNLGGWISTLHMFEAALAFVLTLGRSQRASKFTHCRTERNTL